MERTRKESKLTAPASLEPQYSRPLDVHRFSEHTEIGKLVQHIWGVLNSEEPSSAHQTGGVKPKADSEAQLRVLILDLYVAWLTDPDLSIGVHLSNTAWNTNSRYNALHLSRKIPGLVHGLHDAGFIELAKGSYAGPGAPTNRTARIIAAEPLREMFRKAKFGMEHITVYPDRECIVMHADKGAKEVEYEDNESTIEMREELNAYNALLARTFIDVPDQDKSYIERPIKQGPRKGDQARVSICHSDNFVRRIFNREDWSLGGRFFGGWWQSVGSEFRKRIHINCRPTVEVDFQALHIAILYAEHGVVLEGDPYELVDGLIEGVSALEQRNLVKLLVLMALNAKSPQAACQAFRKDCAVGSRGKSMKNKQLLAILEAFIAKHPHLVGDLCSDRGISLMNTDSRIAANVIRLLTRLKVPVLCIHDSFVVDYEKAGLLKGAMTASARSVLGCPVALSNNYLGLDEVRSQMPTMVNDYLAIRERPACDTYKVRRRLFRERMAYLGSLEG